MVLGMRCFWSRFASSGKGIVSIKAASKSTLLLGSSGTGDLSTVYLLGPEHSKFIPSAPDRTPSTWSPDGTPDPAATGGDAAADPADAGGGKKGGTGKDLLPVCALSGIAHVGFVRCISAGGDSCALVSHDKVILAWS